MTVWLHVVVPAVMAVVTDAQYSTMLGVCARSMLAQVMCWCCHFCRFRLATCDNANSPWLDFHPVTACMHSLVGCMLPLVVAPTGVFSM